MSRRALEGLPVREAAQEVLSWSPTTDEWLKSLSDRQLEQAAGGLLDVWGTVALSHDALGDLVIENEDGDELAGRELVTVVVLHCAIFVNDLLREKIRRGGDISPGSDWFKEPIRRHLDPDRELAGLVEHFTMAYWGFLTSVLGTPLMRELQPIEPYATAIFEEQSHNALGALNSIRQDLGEGGSKYGELLGEFGLSAALRLLWDIYRGLRDQAEGLWKSGDPVHPGPYSQMRLRELPALASRASVMVDRYGEKRVEKVFETQLSLLVQSLGFAVVRTRSGERRVDLLCIAGGPGEFTFLLEAKTSARPYSFSTADERALSEYVRDVRRSVAGNIPALRFVLLVGASRGQNSRLQVAEVRGGELRPDAIYESGCPREIAGGLAGPSPGPDSGGEAAREPVGCSRRGGR
jgi:hypothetical protein